MNDVADRLAGVFVSAGVETDREFEARLADSSALAFRVAYSVLRQREDAEDAAQEAFAARIESSPSCATAIGSAPGSCG